jgi:hypothetical protein
MAEIRIFSDLICGYPAGEYVLNPKSAWSQWGGPGRLCVKQLAKALTPKSLLDTPSLGIAPNAS